MSSSQPRRRFKIEPVETTTRTSRKQPIAESGETSPGTSSSPVSQPSQSVTSDSKPRRRFAPELVETSSASSKDKPEQEEASTQKGKFAPELVETTTSSRRQGKPSKIGQEREERDEDSAAPLPSSAAKPKRKFAPQLVETAQRSRKAGDTTPALRLSDRTEATRDDSADKARRRRRPGPALVDPGRSLSQGPDLLEARRLGMPLARRQSSRDSLRSHSFRVPELDPIESSESDRSNAPSFSTSPSSSSDMSSRMNSHSNFTRNEAESRSPSYLQEMATKAAERHMREQIMAAFPNDGLHEPVEHYVDRDSESGSRHIFSFHSRDSDKFTEVDWELRDLRRHHAKLEAQREQEKKSRAARRAIHARKASQPSASSPWRNAAAALLKVDDSSKDPEMERMRKGARPPMLGKEIKFPRCSSPEPARFDVTQGSHALRNAMCYLTEQSKDAEPEGLWCDKKQAKGDKNQAKKSTGGMSLWSSGSGRTSSQQGLWHGSCMESGLQVPRGPTGIVTPKVEGETEREAASQMTHQLPPSPPPSNSGIGSLDEKLALEKEIEEEFDDQFTCQLYNYLALGYPALGRKFDFELSKITGISVDDLRQDDHLAAATRGYIRLGEDEKACEDGITEEKCARWRALRAYAREWARQQSGQRFAAHEAWGVKGVPGRKGSWGF